MLLISMELALSMEGQCCLRYEGRDLQAGSLHCPVSEHPDWKLLKGPLELVG